MLSDTYRSSSLVAPAPRAHADCRRGLAQRSASLESFVSRLTIVNRNHFGNLKDSGSGKVWAQVCSQTYGSCQPRRINKHTYYEHTDTHTHIYIYVMYIYIYIYLYRCIKRERERRKKEGERERGRERYPAKQCEWSYPLL